jgi:hypothetical protein
MRYAKHLREVILQLAALALLLGSIVLLYANNGLLLTVALVETLAALRRWHEPFDIAAAVVIGAVGSIAEAVFVTFGVWRYANPSLLGIPVWFPVAFGLAGLIGQRLVRSVLATWERQCSDGATLS